MKNRIRLDNMQPGKPQQDACPAISYVFVDGQYYARTISVSDGNKHDMYNKMKTSFAPYVKDREQRRLDCGGNMSDGIKLKRKCNVYTDAVKSATYSTRLHAQLAKAFKNDPIRQYDNELTGFWIDDAFCLDYCEKYSTCTFHECTSKGMELAGVCRVQVPFNFPLGVRRRTC